MAVQAQWSGLILWDEAFTQDDCARLEGYVRAQASSLSAANPGEPLPAVRVTMRGGWGAAPSAYVRPLWG